MSKKLKHLLAVLLLLVFVTPTTVKLLDESFHHHFYFSYSGKKSETLHEYHRTCPIPGFNLAFFSLQKQIHVIEKKEYCGDILLPLPIGHFSFELNLSTLLRAPPLLDKIV